MLYDCIEKAYKEAVGFTTDLQKETDKKDEGTPQPFMETVNEAKQYMSELRPLIKLWIELWGKIDDELTHDYSRHEMERIASVMLMQWASIVSSRW